MIVVRSGSRQRSIQKNNDQPLHSAVTTTAKECEGFLFNNEMR